MFTIVQNDEDDRWVLILFNVLVCQQANNTRSLVFIVMLVFMSVADAGFSFTKHPLNPTVVVLGYNSSRVTLAWDYNAGGETIGTMRIQRLNNSNSKGVTLASGFGPTPNGKVKDAFSKDGHFGYEDPVTLVINQVTTKDKFVYRCVVQTSENSDGYKSDINLEVYSKFYDIHIIDICFISLVLLLFTELK